MIFLLEKEPVRQSHLRREGNTTRTRRTGEFRSRSTSGGLPLALGYAGKFYSRSKHFQDMETSSSFGVERVPVIGNSGNT